MDMVFNQNGRDFPEKCSVRLDLKTEIKFATGSASGFIYDEETSELKWFQICFRG